MIAMCHKKRRITAWRYDNPREVEFAFRQGFLAGIRWETENSGEDIFAKYDRVRRLRYLQH